MKKLMTALLCLCTLALCACGGATQDVDFASVKQAVIDVMEADLREGGFGDDAFTEEAPLPGYMIMGMESVEYLPVVLDADQVKDVAVFMAMINVRSDLIMLVEAKDEAAAKAVEAAYGDTKAQQEQVWGTYLPDQYEKVKNTKIGRVGNLVYYVTYDDAAAVENAILGK